jgi:hypothetical protein
MVSLRIKTQPICEPVSVDLLKSQLYLTTDLDDALLAVYIQAAREYIEGWTNRSFIRKTYEMRASWLPLFDYRMQGWVTGNAPSPGWYNGLWVADSLKFKLYRTYLIPGTSQIQYVDLNSELQTMTPVASTNIQSANVVTNYQEGCYSDPSILLPLPGSFWPWTQYSTPEAVIITYDASQADEAAIDAALEASPPGDEVALRQAAVPGWAQLAILMLAAHFFEHREAVTDLKLEECPLGVKNIISMYTVEDFCPTRG